MLSPFKIKRWALCTMPIQDGVGDSRIWDHLVPVLDRPSRRGSLIKILWHDGIGMSLYAKRLESRLAAD
jgi:hypothetical protein